MSTTWGAPGSGARSTLKFPALAGYIQTAIGGELHINPSAPDTQFVLTGIDVWVDTPPSTKNQVYASIFTTGDVETRFWHAIIDGDFTMSAHWRGEFPIPITQALQVGLEDTTQTISIVAWGYGTPQVGYGVFL